MTHKLTTALLASGVLALGACSGSDTDGDAPTITSFTASPSTVQAGGSATLSWAVGNVDAASITITAGGTNITTSAELTGNVEVTVQQTTTYTLVATAGGETAMGTVTVTAMTVNPDELAILRFDAAPNPAPAGGMTSLTWETQNATNIKITDGANEIYNGADATGSRQATLTAASHTYTIEATDGTDTVTDTVTVTTEAGGEVTSFTATPLTFPGAAQDVTLSWAGVGSSFTLTANGTNLAGFNGNATGTQTVNITETTTFVFSATGGGSTDSETVTVVQAVGEVEPNADRMTATPVTGGAQGEINPVGDVDFFSFTVPQGGYVIAETSDGMGDCPGDTVIDLWDENGMDPLGSNDDGGVGTCSRIDAADDAFARNLAAGTYYVSVIRFSNTSTLSYTLAIQTGGPGCGNSVPETGEECDDGNTAAGDGCSATCEVEFDGTVTNAGQFETFSGSIDIDRRRIYEIQVAAASTIRAETGVATLGLCTADTVIELQDSNFEMVERDDDGGINACSLLFADVEPGTYYLEVIEFGSNALIPAFEVSIAVLPQGCGNALLEMGEQCDDGNSTAGDGCSATCTFDAMTLANPGGSVSGTLARAGLPETTLAAITIAEGETITATTTNCTFPNAIGLLGDDGMGEYILLGGVTAQPPEQCAGFEAARDTFAVGLPAGTYYIIGVTQEGTGGAVNLDVTITAPMCGNGMIEGAELCDDNNTTPGDGCDAMCNIEGVLAEAEPNNDSATATPLPGPTNTIAGRVNPVGDVDYYAVTVAANQGISATTYTMVGDPTVCAGADTLIEIRDPTGMNILAENDDSEPGVNLCSAIDPTVDAGAAMLAAGTYYVVVRHWNDSGTTVPYLLDIAVQ